jgi:hypothetical protein
VAGQKQREVPVGQRPPGRPVCGAFAEGHCGGFFYHTLSARRQGPIQPLGVRREA